MYGRRSVFGKVLSSTWRLYGVGSTKSKRRSVCQTLISQRHTTQDHCKSYEENDVGSCNRCDFNIWDQFLVKTVYCSLTFWQPCIPLLSYGNIRHSKKKKILIDLPHFAYYSLVQPWSDLDGTHPSWWHRYYKSLNGPEHRYDHWMVYWCGLVQQCGCLCSEQILWRAKERKKLRGKWG